MLASVLDTLASLFGPAGLSRISGTCDLWLLSFAVVWLTAEIVTLLVLLGLWIVRGFGGRLHREPYQSRHPGAVGVSHGRISMLPMAAQRKPVQAGYAAPTSDHDLSGELINVC